MSFSVFPIRLKLEARKIIILLLFILQIETLICSYLISALRRSYKLTIELSLQTQVSSPIIGISDELHFTGV